MKALAIASRDSVPELQDIDVPQPGTGEVLVAVEAASVNGMDAAIASGTVWDVMKHTFPVVIGRDFAGTVTAVGDDVEGVAVGDRVAGAVGGRLGPGTFGELVAARLTGVAPIPAGVDSPTAAAVVLAGITALDATEAAGVSRGDVVVVSGATGGVGHLAVQLAANRGATVIATTKPGRDDFVRSLGATHTVDYTGDVAAQLRAIAPGEVDIVIHAAGDPANLAAALRAGGTLVSIIGARSEQLGRDDVNVSGIFFQPNAEKLATLLSQVADGTLRPYLSTTVPFGSAGEALAAFQGGKVGKLVITR